jgi:glycerophosphoryl diester phosphodiesterase
MIALRFMLFLVGLLVVWRFFLWHPRKLLDVTRKPPLLLGHRGVRGKKPENTIEAFKLAFESGLDGIECDVQRSKDGELVLFHDFDIHGKTLNKLSYLHIKSLDSQVPKLDELFELSQQYPGTLLNVELKTERLRTDGLEKDTVVLIRKWGLEGRVLISSFNPMSLLRVRFLAPDIRVGLLYYHEMRWWLKNGMLAGWLHVDAIHPYHPQVNPQLIKRAKVRNLMVNTWTVNEPMRISSLHDMGITAIIGDDPEVLKSTLVRDDWRGTANDSKVQTDYFKQS